MSLRENVEQYIICFKNGFYGNTLVEKFVFPTSLQSISVIDEALELLSGFKVFF